ncbi:MAG: hypothetical protein O6938_02795 [Gammaproteobacteria bacterium]|nr:hypothetical protein [Gammaproteobacteria bacterium]MCZ6722826.1 hypothetical protein [Gammaproteobacteria bacterium]MCZ6796473.1 hypothetical protein [Gammaproteobacteria bacterium]MCZ6883597.1 hypothetical protein [Gammaproteobacteria bacterium]
MTEPTIKDKDDDHTEFRFFDNRQKYLLFVNTCSEKWVIGERIARELKNISPTPPSIRIFDAGIGDGTVLSRVWRAMHHHFPTMPFSIHGKEVSLEDVRLTLDKLPDRLYEHPASVVVLTNLYYGEAPWLTPRSPEAAKNMVWKEVSLTGNSAHEFEQQIVALQDFLSENWQARTGKHGNPVYERPVALILYRDDHRFLLDAMIPRRESPQANFDLIIASQPYRAIASAESKAKNVVTPLARALAPHGRLIGVHSMGNDPGMEIVEAIWPGQNPFTVSRQEILEAVKVELGDESANYFFSAGSNIDSLFNYEMHTLPNEIDSSIGTSTLLAAWNAATYVAQVEDDRLEAAMHADNYISVTRAVLKKRGGLWFQNESYTITRK